jgi:UDP-N-acetylmuramate dehydrogenase
MMEKSMTATDETLRRLHQIPNVQVSAGAVLARYTRFGLGGPADVLVETADAEGFATALEVVRVSGLDHAVIGSGTNLVVADEGFRGVVLRYTANKLTAEGNRVTAEAGAELQQVVDFTIAHGLAGLETLAGIPGSLGAAVYGNAGAYGHSMAEIVVIVRFFDGQRVRTFGNAECEFCYRESVFKRRKEFIIFSAELELTPGDEAVLRRTADEILAVRNAKFPPTMKCAGSVFKNLLIAELPAAVSAPANVVREGKIPAAYFLEQVGAKGMRRGGICVADYHANLVYNAGAGTAREFRDLIGELKAKVRELFGIELEEEVQYVGFDAPPTSRS